MSSSLRERLARHKIPVIPASASVAEAPPGVRVTHVDPGSLCAEAGIVVGDKLLRMNGEGIRDTVDYYFHGSDEEVVLELENADGSVREVLVEKEWPEQGLGLEVEQFTTQACGCNCVFCFVHQLPDAMRLSLYVKDEDYRHSFLNGSYMTGITLKEPDLERIARQRLTPLYISVHAVDEELRRWLLGVKKSLPILDLLTFFRKHRITIHTQVVLCPGHNDGEQLERTLRTLERFHPTVASVAIVPVGLTKWREGLPDLKPVTPEYARTFIREVHPHLRTLSRNDKAPFALLADEWYLIAGGMPPAYTEFVDLPQLSNGVGVVYHFYKDMAKARRRLPKELGKRWSVAALTSTLSGPVLDRVIRACEKSKGLTVTRIPVVNTVFGETIHVTGLLCGRDIRKAIRDNPGHDQYLLPGNCLRHSDAKFLDDITLDQLRRETGANITPVLGGSLDFVESILESAIGLRHRAATDHVFMRPHWAPS